MEENTKNRTNGRTMFQPVEKYIKKVNEIPRGTLIQVAVIM